MAGESVTSNMSLTLPGVGLTSGPTYATEINNAFITVDQHDHSSGHGVPVTPSGLSISSDLSFQNNNLTLAKSVRFYPQNSPLAAVTDVGCVYVSGVDLYFNDVSGNQIRLTQSAGVAGTPGSISNLVSPASASYVAGNQTFVWQSDVVTPANMDMGSIILRNISASSYGFTINPPAAMGANYTWTLPILPASNKILRVDNTGAVTSSLDVDGTSIVISSNTLKQGTPASVSITGTAIDWASGNVYYKSLTGNTTFTFSNNVDGKTIVCFITCPPAAYTSSFPSGVSWPGGVTPTQSPGYYLFTCSAATASSGDTYTNNSITFTVIESISSGTSLKCTGSGAPSSTGTLTRATGSGSSSITFSANSVVNRTDVVTFIQCQSTVYGAVSPNFP